MSDNGSTGAVAPISDANESPAVESPQVEAAENQESEKKAGLQSLIQKAMGLAPKEEPKEEVKAEEAEPSFSQEDSKEDEAWGQKFAALSRQEKAIREREIELDQKNKEYEERIKSLEEKYSGYDSFDERIKKEPLKILEEKGINLETLSEFILNDGKSTPEMQIKETQEMLAKMQAQHDEKIEALRKEYEDREAEKEAKIAEQQYEAQEKGFKSEIADFVNEDQSKYKMVRAYDADNQIYDVIETHYNDQVERGVPDAERTILSIEEAADAVEEYYMEQYKALQEKINGPSENTEGQSEEDKGELSPTLSNDLNTQASTKTVGDRLLSDEESKSKAAQLIKWD